MKIFRFDKKTREIIKNLTKKFIALLIMLMYALAFTYIGVGVITHF